MGRDYRSHICLSRKGRHTFKPVANFFNFLAGGLAASSSETLRRIRCSVATGRVGKTRQIKNLLPHFDPREEEEVLEGAYCAAERLAAAGLPAAMAAAGTFKARVAGASWRSESFPAAGAGASDAATTGAAATAETAA